MSDVKDAEVVVHTGDTGQDSIVRIQSQELQKAAREVKRDQKLIREQVLEELMVYPEFAEENYYEIPNRGANLSIRAAETLVGAYGGCDVSAQIDVDPDDEHATITGLFVDLEKLIRWQAPLRISRYQKRRSGQMVRMGDAEWEQKIAATVSKAMRNAALRGLPAGLKKVYFDTCRQIAAQGVSAVARKQDKPTWQVVEETFQRWNVTRMMLERLVGKDLSTITEDDVGMLKGVANAIKSGERSVADIFENGQRARVEEVDLDKALADTETEQSGASAQDHDDSGGAHTVTLEDVFGDDEKCMECNRKLSFVKKNDHKPDCSFKGVGLEF